MDCLGIPGLTFFRVLHKSYVANTLSADNGMVHAPAPGHARLAMKCTRVMQATVLVAIGDYCFTSLYNILQLCMKHV